ncbi:hypothetical protein CALCODRAFT_435718, partial [Calocera cornea HHB12733]
MYIACLAKLEKLIRTHNKTAITGHLHLQRLRTLCAYYNLRRKKYGKIAASEVASESHGRAKVWGGRLVRRWAAIYERTGTLPQSRRGRHIKTFSLLNDPDICAQLRAYLRSNKWSMNPGKLAEYTANVMLPAECDKYTKSMVYREMPKGMCRYLQETRWMRREGFRYMSYKKAVYLDGHERPDVVEYRQNVFLPTMAEFQPRMREWMPGNVHEEIVKNPAHGRPLVKVVHDESTFTAHDGEVKSWVLDNQFKLRKKGAGRGLHRSDFLCSSVGWLHEAGQQIEYGKNHDGYWTGEMLCNQLQ